MAYDIALKIYMPERVVLDKPVYRVVLPNNEMPLTVIEGRAPTLMAMDMGVIKILDDNNQTIEEYLIAGGSADIKEDTCEILTEAAFNKAELTLEQVREMNAEFPNPFYRWLVKEFEKEANIK